MLCREVGQDRHRNADGGGEKCTSVDGGGVLPWAEFVDARMHARVYPVIWQRKKAGKR